MLFVTCTGAPKKVCGGSIITGAIFVYIGNTVIATSKVLSIVRGQGKDVVDEAGMVDDVPVCHGKYLEKDLAGRRGRGISLRLRVDWWGSTCCSS
jgi:hypothetical protein